MKLPINYDKEHWSVRREARKEYVKLQDEIVCPFCYDTGFDKIGLKNHIEMGHCKIYSAILTVEEEREANSTAV